MLWKKKYHRGGNEAEKFGQDCDRFSNKVTLSNSIPKGASVGPAVRSRAQHPRLPVPDDDLRPLEHLALVPGHVRPHPVPHPAERLDCLGEEAGFDEDRAVPRPVEDAEPGRIHG